MTSALRPPAFFLRLAPSRLAPRGVLPLLAACVAAAVGCGQDPPPPPAPPPAGASLEGVTINGIPADDVTALPSGPVTVVGRVVFTEAAVAALDGRVPGPRLSLVRPGPPDAPLAELATFSSTTADGNRDGTFRGTVDRPFEPGQRVLVVVGVPVGGGRSERFRVAEYTVAGG